METLSYWLARLEPIIRTETEGEIIVVLANRSGTEDEAVYAGTSCVLGIHAGEVKVYGILGRGERELLVVDTDVRPQAKLIAQSASTNSVPSSEESIDSQSTLETTPEADDLLTALDDMMTPVSPVEPMSSHGFFSSRDQQDSTDGSLQTLRSSVDRQRESSLCSESPIPVQPQSPKPHGESRTRELENQGSALTSHNAELEGQGGVAADVACVPQSAPAVPVLQPRNASLGPRSRHVSPRPKSSIW
jgi:protein N-terminal amidase